MAWFKVNFLTSTGGLEVARVEAESRSQAISKSGISAQIIQSVSPDPFGGIKQSLTEKKLPLIDQALILISMASKISSGKPFNKAIKESLDFKKLGIQPSDLSGCVKPHEYLAKLRFDDSAVLLAEVGDSAGQLPEALNRAAESIRDRVKAAKEFGKSLALGLLYSALGIASIVVVPIWAGGYLHEMIEVQRLPLRMNVLSNAVVALGSFYATAWPFLLAALLGFYIMRERAWNSLRHVVGLHFINERLKIKRALDFVVSYHILHLTGVPDPQAFKFMQSRSKGLTYRLYQDAIQLLKEGRPLAEVFNNDEWPRLLHQNLQGFDNHRPAGRDVVLKNLVEALKAYYVEYSSKIATFASITGFILMLMTIMLLAVGFYLPIANMQTIVRGQ